MYDVVNNVMHSFRRTDKNYLQSVSSFSYGTYLVKHQPLISRSIPCRYFFYFTSADHYPEVEVLTLTEQEETIDFGLSVKI